MPVRKTFGKPLAQHQVIRHKIMECARHVMATHGMILPLLAQQKTPFNHDHNLAGAIALCKYQATRTYELVARGCSEEKLIFEVVQECEWSDAIARCECWPLVEDRR